MRLSTLNVDGVCKLLSTLEDLSQSAVPEYIRLIKENNINGRVLLHCDLDDLKKVSWLQSPVRFNVKRFSCCKCLSGIGRCLK